ncbi:MAG: glutaredoxin 3 [Tatlockia sp.]|jgi:glutaredoxin 3
MPTVLMYSVAQCPYCVLARQLLDKKNISYIDIRVDEAPEKRQEMIEKSGRYTVPQLFIDGQSIGGCDDLYALDEQGKLDKLLQK